MITNASRDDCSRSARARRTIAAALAAIHIAQPAIAQTTVNLSNVPLAGYNIVKPNLIVGYDDSGSMDNEVLLPTSDGALWYNNASRTFWSTAGVFNVNNSRTGHDQFSYLFPNGSSSSSTSDKRRYTDDWEFFAIPPIPFFAALRSAAYNPLYYNPAVRYRPWAPAYIGSSTVTFANASPTAARWHPVLTGTATINLTATQSSTSSDWTFRFPPGTTIPGASISGITGSRNGYGGFSSITSNYTVGSTEYYDVNVPYYPATYWIVDNTCNSGSNCGKAPDGKNLRRIEIRSSTTAYTKAAGRTDCVTSTSSCTYAEELQNFANWFQYHRKRRLAMAAGLGQALSSVQGIRGGLAFFNNRGSTSNVTMYDFSDPSPGLNAQRLIGMTYQSDAMGGTPTRDMLKYIGTQYARTGTGAPIQYGCQRNAAFIATDGYNTDSTTTAPTYNRTTWVNSPPYTAIPTNSLADIASAYYTNNPRPDLPTGLLSFDPTASGPNVDRNTNLHVNTYALTLGALGTIYGTASASANDPFANPPTWPTPSTASPTAIDDLWHATINGRGDMYSALTADDVSSAMDAVVGSIMGAAGSDAGIAVSSNNISPGNNTAYISSYNAKDWSGQLAAYAVDTTTGTIDLSPGRELWKARELLDARSPGSRIIASHNGTTGVAFTTGGSGLSSTLVSGLALTASPDDGAQVLAYLRGDRSREGSTYRARGSLLGDIVSAEPVVYSGIVYQPANDGMLHAFDAANGNELWAYVPYNVLGNLKQLANPLYSHRFFVDGTPVVRNMDGTRTILVGGLRGGGPGYYAIDITSPRVNTETLLASKVLWELPNATTSATLRSQLGASYGEPVIVKTQTGQWVVLVTSGYNNSSGQSHLHVLDALTGTLIRTLTPPSGFGLAQIAARVPDPTIDPTVDFVYGGDLQGNVWRFDLRGATTGWNVVLLAALGSTQPITAPPELVTIAGNRVVIVGTGRLLGNTDANDTSVQSVYALKDNLTATPTIANPRGSTMQRQTVTIGADNIRNITSTAVNWSTMNGWYFDLPAGERVTTDPSVAFGAFVFTTNLPSPPACSAASYLYAVSMETGGQLNSSAFVGTPWSGRPVGFTYASRPILVTLPSGSLVTITHRSDSTISNAPVPTSMSSRLRRHAWREVLR